MNHNDNKILSHSTWNCKYHIVFAPKYRRKIFYESRRKEIMEIIKELCRWKEVEILEGEMAVDHVHLLLMIPPKLSVSGFMGYLKGKSSLMIYQRWGAAKYQYRCREFWCRGYYVDTFTYSDDKMTEEEFAKKLLNTLYHFSSRKGWLYIGAWERGGETNRLHFHGLFYIPEGTMSGEMEILRDFDTRKRKMQTVQQNTFFAKRFGRNSFRPIDHVSEMPQAVQYLVKYIEKSGGKLIYSRGLYQYFVTDIMDEDIVCPYGLEDRKILLFDSFGCWVEGEYIGQVSPEVIKLLPKET